MMKAQIRQEADQIILQVCGRLAEGWVAELEKCWDGAKSGHVGARFSIDLRGVTFIDPSGERLLRRMHHEGADLIASGLLIQEVVHRITGNSK
ncbi:MAG: hypothetical protein ACRD30_07110 [Bryobacteraceae bacterium]